MKENNLRIIFFIVILFLLIISIYYVIKNKNTIKSQETQTKQEIKIDNNINLGIITYDTLNPILSNSEDIQNITKLIYKPLIDITEDFKLKQGLAEEWNKLDNKTYLIKLKENIFWENGEEFTTKDVEYTINNIRNNKSIYNNNIQNIDNIEIINNYIMKIYLKEPEENFEYLLCFPIISSTENIGLGDYAIINYEPNLVLKCKTSKKQITIKTYKNLMELYNAFIQEEVDLIVTKNINYQNYIGKIGHVRNIIVGREFNYLKYNLQNNLLKNEEVVKAINLAINKNEINNKIFNNLYYTAEFPLQYGSYLYNNNIDYEYNINKAQKLLENAGWVYNRQKLAKKWINIKTNHNNKYSKTRSSKNNKTKFRSIRFSSKY